MMAPREAATKFNDGLTQRTALHPSAPKSCNHTCAIPKPAIRVKIMIVAMAEEKTPNKSAPNSLARIK